MTEDQGIPHIRYTRLRQVTQKALSECLKPLTLENLAYCYPSLQNTSEGHHLLETIQKSVTDTLKTSSEFEIDLILKDLQVKEKLDLLDELIYVAQKRRDKDLELEQDKQGKLTPAGDLTKEGVIQSYLLPIKQDLILDLKEQCDELKQENYKLLKELMELSDQARTLKNDVDGSLDLIQRLSDFENEAVMDIDRHVTSLREDVMMTDGLHAFK